MATKKKMIIFFSILFFIGLSLILISVLVEEDYLEINSAVIENPSVSLENRDGKACIVISGGVADITVKGYSDTVTKPLIEEKIKKLFYFDLQENNSWRYPLGTNFHSVNLLDQNHFEIVADITAARGNDALMIHFVHAGADGSFPSAGGNGLDFKPDIDNFEYTLSIDSVSYTAIYDKINVWGLIYITIQEQTT